MRRSAGALLVCLGALSLWAVPFASTQVRGVEEGSAHLVAGSIAVLLLVTATGFASAAFGRRFGAYSIPTVVAFVAFGVRSGPDSPALVQGLATPWMGVKERISVYNYQPWLLCLRSRCSASRVERWRRLEAASPDSPRAAGGRGTSRFLL